MVAAVLESRARWQLILLEPRSLVPVINPSEMGILFLGNVLLFSRRVCHLLCCLSSDLVAGTSQLSPPTRELVVLSRITGVALIVGRSFALFASQPVAL